MIASEVRERPILFSSEMVRSILEGRKTQTRRVADVRGADRVIWCPNGQFVPARPGDEGFRGWVAEVDKLGGEKGLHLPLFCPYGQPGDRLWVRETFLPDPPIDGWPGDIEWNGCGRSIAGVPEHYRSPENVIFKATWKGDSELKWRPGIHMPRWASRLSLEITKIRIERVQDISHEDATAEGCRPYCVAFDKLPAQEYRELWNKINAKRGFGWDVNPWVWCISFRRIR